MEQAEPRPKAVLGRKTFTDMGCVEQLFSPREPDAWGMERTPFSPSVARLSAELTADGYELDLAPWIDAGWDDCTFVVEDKIFALDRGRDTRLATMESEWRLRRARSMIRGSNPLGDLTRAIRQLMVTDMGKTIVMTRVMPGGRAVVAISFIGTTEKYYDWFTNFKFQHDGGMHRGFMELARGFDAHTPRVLLPKLAAALGEETLTLADVLLRARDPEGGVALWVSGHSQGGALAQTYTSLLLRQGVCPACVHGYTFAAPTVAVAGCGLVPGDFPIYNVVSTDDVVPRIGAQVRLGVDLVYHPNEAFRRRYYRVEKGQWDAFDHGMFIASRIQSTQDAVCWGLALIRLMHGMEDDERLEAFFSVMLPQVALLKRLKLSPFEVASFLEEKLLGQYKRLSGEEPDPVLCASYEEDIRVMLSDCDARAVGQAILAVLISPHRMRPDSRDETYVPPYIGVVRRHLGECERGIWSADAPARCLDVQGTRLLPQETHAPMPLIGGHPALTGTNPPADASSWIEETGADMPGG